MVEDYLASNARIWVMVTMAGDFFWFESVVDMYVCFLHETY